MATTLEELEKRLAALEQEVSCLRHQLESRAAEETAAQRGARMLREAKAGQAAFSAALTKAFAEMGISGEPVGAERLQQMMIESGINPEDNAFSRGIIEMREE